LSGQCDHDADGDDVVLRRMWMVRMQMVMMLLFRKMYLVMDWVVSVIMMQIMTMFLGGCGMVRMQMVMDWVINAMMKLLLVMLLFRKMWMVMDWLISAMRTQIVMLLQFRYMWMVTDWVISAMRTQIVMIRFMWMVMD
jgi:hypothetical protein